MYYVYILANKTNAVLYVGVTGDLVRRLQGDGAFTGPSAAPFALRSG